MLGRGGMGVANHAKQAVALGLTVNAETGVENFVATVLAVGLGEHHQLGVAGVAPHLAKCIKQIIDFVNGQSQTPIGIGLFQSLTALGLDIDKAQSFGWQGLKQRMGSLLGVPQRFGHAVVQQGLNRQRFIRGQAGVELHAVLDQAFNTLH